jgi:hypothetical protein
LTIVLVVLLIGVPELMTHFGDADPMGSRQSPYGGFIGTPVHCMKLLLSPIVVLLKLKFQGKAVEFVQYYLLDAIGYWGSSMEGGNNMGSRCLMNGVVRGRIFGLLQQCVAAVRLARYSFVGYWSMKGRNNGL